MSGQAGMRVDWRALWASGDLFRFCFVSLGILLHATNETMIATIMPAMVGDLSGVELVGWSLAVYELGAISAGAAAGGWSAMCRSGPTWWSPPCSMRPAR